MTRVVLSSPEVALLMKPVRGRGGFQTLLRSLQGQLQGTVLILPPVLVARVIRYRNRYGAGGFQGRLAFLQRVDLDSAA
jgi:hypothetical protein